VVLQIPIEISCNLEEEIIRHNYVHAVNEMIIRKKYITKSLPA